MLTAGTLLVALGLDNAALGGGIEGPWRLWWRRASLLGAAALCLALGGAVAGDLVRSWLSGWAQLIGAVLVFTLAVDGLRAVVADTPRILPDALGERGARQAVSLLTASLDELGVGFAVGGSLHGVALLPWGGVCLVETVGAMLLGFLLRHRLAEGRRLLPWWIASLFAASSLLLLVFPVVTPLTPGGPALGAPGP